MSDMQLQSKQVHIIGIGGIGTSAVAKYFHLKGIPVTGSDVHDSALIQELDGLGVRVKIGHFADNVPGDCELIVYSSAVPATNVERQVAEERGIPMLSFAEFLGAFAKTKKTIAVSGTNGKSTTTAMLAKIFIDAGEDPTVILGTKSPDLPYGNLRVGESEWLIIEACEHMAHMLEVRPDIAVITNIEEDHLDFYRDLDHIKETFKTWAGQSKQVLINRQNPNSVSLGVDAFSFDVADRRLGKGKQVFRAMSMLDQLVTTEVTLQIPGEFNAENAAAATSAALLAGINPHAAAQALKDFRGTWRRFERVGNWKEATVYSDYAHHPTAVAGTLRAFREFFPTARLVLLFEPHQHSRTHELFDDFVKCFDEADVLILSEIYEVAGRTEERFESAEEMAEKVKLRGKIDAVKYAKDHAQAEDHLRDLVQPGDMIIVMGAGSIDNVARKLAE